ncbi:MAG TPA: hypothetical protein VGB73_16090 [Pyrinomonadaceae bacterium]
MSRTASLPLSRRLIISLTVVVASLCAALAALPFCLETARAANMLQGGYEYINVYASDCVTPKSVFSLGETVCVQAGNFPLTPGTEPNYRRFQWISPDNNVVDTTGIKADPQNDRYIIPTSGQFAQVGTWYIKTINSRGEGEAGGRFIVRNLNIRLADMTIGKSGPQIVLPGDRVEYKLTIRNAGPDTATSIEFMDEVPTNMIFVALKQASGGFFECTTPAQGETGRSVCRTKGMRLDEEATFVFYYQVNPDLRDGTVCGSNAQVTTLTEERDKTSNTTYMESTVSIPNDNPEPPPGEPR